MAPLPISASDPEAAPEWQLRRLKRDEITHYKLSVEIELVRRIKYALDPANIMNPAKL